MASSHMLMTPEAMQPLLSAIYRGTRCRPLLLLLTVALAGHKEEDLFCFNCEHSTATLLLPLPSLLLLLLLPLLLLPLLLLPLLLLPLVLLLLALLPLVLLLLVGTLKLAGERMRRAVTSPLAWWTSMRKGEARKRSCSGCCIQQEETSTCHSARTS